MESGIFGATDLIIGHDDLRVQREPLPWTLLRTERHFAADTQTQRAVQVDEPDENKPNPE